MFNLRRHPLSIFFVGAFGISWPECAFDFSAVWSRCFSHQIAKHIFAWFGAHRVPVWITVASLDRRWRSHRTETLLRAVAWLSSLDLAASDPDRYDCGNALRSARSLGALSTGTYSERIYPWNWTALLNFRYYFILSLVAGPIGEEPGWRGFALPVLQSRYRQSPSDPLKLRCFWGSSGRPGIFPFSLYRMDNIAVLDLRQHRHFAFGHYYLGVQSLRRERHHGDSGARYFQRRWCTAP